MTFDTSKNDQPVSDSDLNSSSVEEKSPAHEIPLTHWQLRRLTVPSAMWAVHEPLIAAATHAEASRQMVARNNSLENIAGAIESTLAEILLAGHGLHQLSAKLQAKELWWLEKESAAHSREVLAVLMAIDTLTARERQVLSAAVDGLDNQKIAAKLHISGRTVESHRASIARKFKVSSLAELFRTAAALGVSLASTGDTP